MSNEQELNIIPDWDGIHCHADVTQEVRDYLERTNGTKTYGYGDPEVIDTMGFVHRDDLMYDRESWVAFWKRTIQYRRGILTAGEYRYYLGEEIITEEERLLSR